MGCGTSTAAEAGTPAQVRVLELQLELERERANRLEQEAQLRGRKELSESCAELKPMQTRAGDTHSTAIPSQDVVATNTEEQAPTPFWTEGRKKLFKGVVQGGVKAIWALCQEYKDVLPFPGGMGVALIGQTAELVGTALANKDNLESLLHRAVELMDIIIEKHVSQEEMSANWAHKGCITKPGSRKFCNLMEQLRDLLEEILSYAQSYCDRNFILKLLMTSSDRDQHSDLADRLARLMVDAHFSVSVDTHTMTVEVHAMSAEMKQMLTSVRSAMPYVDHSSEVKRMVESLGGMDAVLGSEAKVEQVAKHLDHGQQITIAMLNNQVHASLLAALAKNETGVHTIIRNTDMRTFWRQFFNGMTKVEWDIWWCAFPGRLHDVVKDKEVVDKVASHLSSDSCMAQFQAYIELSDPETLSVREIELAFPLGASILDVVEQALSSTAGSSAHSKPDEAPQQSRSFLRQPSLSRGVRCLLPQLGKEYTGRGKDAATLEALTTQPSSRSDSRTAALCIVAGAGYGKSTLSIDVGWRLAQAGLCPGGAVMIDMREARTFETALGRICGVLEVTMDDHAAKNISAHLTACHRKHNGPMLLLLDNSEDPAGGAGAALFAEFVAEMTRDAMLLITSRVPVAPGQGVQQYDLGSLDATAACSLLCSVAPNLEQQEAEEVAHLCGGVPLLLRRAGDALQTGQIVIEDLKAATAAAADHTSSILHLTLCTLPRQQQLQLAQLAVFPSSFKEDDAAAVLGCDEARASGLLAVLFRHGLVTRDLSASTSSLHAAISAAAAAVGGENVQTKGQERFVVHIMGKLTHWAQLFFTPAWDLPLSLAREAGADILAAFKLAGKLTSQPSSLPENMLSTLLGMDAAQVQILLFYAGNRKGTWSQLEHLYTHLQSNRNGSRDQLAAAAFIRFLAVSTDQGDKNHSDTYSAACEAHNLFAECCKEDQIHACIHALGEACCGQIKYSEAEVLFRQAYEARLRTQGAQAPGTLLSLNKLAECLCFSQRLPHKAESLYQELRTQLLASLGPLHPLSCEAGNGLAGCLSDLGKLTEAVPLYQDVLMAFKRVQGDSHPDTLASMNDLARCLKNQGKLNDAEAINRDALEGRKRVLGESHPDTLASMNDLAMCLEKQGNLSDAETLYHHALETRKRVLGDRHPHTLTSMTTLSSCLEGQGNLSAAEALYRHALEARKHVLGTDHPHTLRSLNHLANCLEKQGNLSDAEALYRHALEARKRVLGDSHPHTLASKNDLTRCLEGQGKPI